VSPAPASLLASALLLLASIALFTVAKNRIARGKLRLAQVALALGLAVAGLIRFPIQGVTIPPSLHAVPDLMLALGIVAMVVAIFLNPLLDDRPAQRFPNIVQDALIVLTFYLIATFVFRDSGIVAASAVSAIVVGFALQDTLGNAFAGLAIQIEKPFRVGNWIGIQGQEGRVEEITWRATKLRTRAGTFVVVPNSIISKEPITNFNEPVVPVRLSVDVGATYLKTPDQVKAAIAEALGQVPLALTSPAPLTVLHDFGSSAIVYRVHFWIAEYESEELAIDQVRTAIYYSFARHGVEIPYPIQVEHSREEPAPSPTPREIAATFGRVELLGALNPE
jgi:small-conductance mechanosensitive channel